MSIDTLVSAQTYLNNHDLVRINILWRSELARLFFLVHALMLAYTQQITIHCMYERICLMR